MGAMRLRYDIVDVFTDRPFAGNQLAVVHGADGLSTEQCQALAREFGFSESTFPSSTVTGGGTYATRIFTPEQEIPFAGHPTLGTAWVLRSLGLLTGDEATGANIVKVAIEAPLKQIALNAGLEPGVVANKVSELPVGQGLNAATGEYVDMFAAGIIDPAKVTRSALQNAASIAGLFLTTEAVVADKPEKVAAPAGDPTGGMDF